MKDSGRKSVNMVSSRLLRFAACLFAGLVILLPSAYLRADAVEEKWPDGKTKLRYTKDKDGKKAGEYQEYYESGKIKIRSHYLAGELNGAYQSFHPNGKPHVTATYKQGQLNGDYSEKDKEGQPVESAAYLDGELNGTKTTYEKGKPVSVEGYLKGLLVYPKGVEQIRAEMIRLLGPGAFPVVKTGKSAHERPSHAKPEPAKPEPVGEKLPDGEAGLHRLMAYRYLTDLAYQDMALDEQMAKATKAAADICAKMKRLDHKPANFGLPEDEYKLAYEGTSHSNLSMGRNTSAENVDMWLNDSDEKNIAALGHRRWCLNPAMLKTGFGRNGEFGAMWSFDQSRKDVPDYDLVAFPPRGYMPINGYFGAEYGWSVSLNPKKYQVPEKGIKVSVTPMDAKFNKDDKSLGNNYFNVETTPYGIGNCIIFRPEKLDISSGKRYWVEITGLKTSDGKEAKVEYLVEFVDMNTPPGK